MTQQLLSCNVRHGALKCKAGCHLRFFTCMFIFAEWRSRDSCEYVQVWLVLSQYHCVFSSPLPQCSNVLFRFFFFEVSSIKTATPRMFENLECSKLQTIAATLTH